jgi:hypothetical protein
MTYLPIPLTANQEAEKARLVQQADAASASAVAAAAAAADAAAMESANQIMRSSRR